ncbi:MAG: DRTGG domain-containing protein [Planctomycetota bacterium]|jgi:predicted transcriptional regulator
MKLKDIKKILEAEVVVGGDLLSEDITIACGCDLMSDVLSFFAPGALLLTGLINPQVVRTAEMADLRAICFVRGKKPSQETIEMAQDKNIPLLTTPLSMFDSCGRLHKEGILSYSEYMKRH